MKITFSFMKDWGEKRKKKEKKKRFMSEQKRLKTGRKINDMETWNFGYNNKE